MSVYRGQPWQQSPDDAARDAQDQYNEYLRQLQQQYQNQAQAIYNTMSEQQANQQLASLGLNFAGDQAQYALGQSRLMGDIGQLGMRQDQARQGMLLDLKQLGWQREQQRLGMQDDIQRQQYQRATNEVPSQFMLGLRQLGY